jgi:hypothetical protein
MRTKDRTVSAIDPIANDFRQRFVPRRKSPRTETLKGAQIVCLGGGPVYCLVRNISLGGACLEVHGQIPQNSFELVFDRDHSRRSCRVVWRQPPRMGVQFQ